MSVLLPLRQQLSNSSHHLRSCLTLKVGSNGSDRSSHLPPHHLPLPPLCCNYQFVSLPCSSSSAAANPTRNPLVGRDNLLRTLQYFSRFYAWYLLRTNAPQRSITPFVTIVKQFGLTRKALRLGKNVEHIKAAAVAVDAKGMDPVLRYLSVGRQLGYALYLSADALSYVCFLRLESLWSLGRNSGAVEEKR